MKIIMVVTAIPACVTLVKIEDAVQLALYLAYHFHQLELYQRKQDDYL